MPHDTIARRVDITDRQQLEALCAETDLSAEAIDALHQALSPVASGIAFYTMR